MKGIMNVSMGYIYLLGLICFTACEDDKPVVHLPVTINESVNIIAVDSSQIFMPSVEILTALGNERSNLNKSTTLFSFCENDPNCLIYSRMNLHIYNEINEIPMDKIKLLLLNVEPDTIRWKKSLLGDFYKFQGDTNDDWREKVILYEKALLCYERSFGSLSDRFLDLLYDVGAIYLYDLGEEETAFPYIKRNISLREERSDLKGRLNQDYYVGAYAQSLRSEFLKALCYIKLASEILVSNPGMNNSSLAIYLNDEANYLFQLGEIELAFACYDRIFSFDEKSLSKDYRVVYHTNYAMMLNGDKKYDRAAIQYGITMELLDPESTYFIYANSNYFDHLLSSGKNEEVILKIKSFLQTSDIEKSNRAFYFDILSLAYERLNMIDSALNYETKAMLIQFDQEELSIFPSIDRLKREYEGDGIDIFVNLLRLKVEKFAKEGDVQNIAKTLLAYDLLDSLFVIQLELGDEESQLHLIDHYTSIFSEALDGYYQLSKFDFLNEKRILDFFERSKAVLLRRQILRSKEYQNYSGQSEQLIKLSNQINYEWEVVKSDYDNYDNYKYLLKCIDSKSKLLEEAELVNSHQFKFVDYKRLNDSLSNQNKLLVSYFSHENTLFAISMDGRKFIFKRWRMDSLAHDKILRFKQFISHEQDMDVNTVQNYEKLAYDIFSIYLKPLVQNKDRKQCMIIPDGPLLQVPFDALVSHIKHVTTYDELAYIIYKDEVNYIYNIENIFDHVENDQNLADEAVVFAYSDKSTILKTAENNFSELPGTIKEIKKLRDAMNIRDRNVFTGEDCTKENFINHVGDASVVHLATHALSDLTAKRLSKVIFRPLSSQDDSTTWMLTPTEIESIKLKANIVFLSACETGMGRVYSGEGTYNLGRSFLSAGAKEVIQSYWILDDFSAAEIVGSFYQNYYQGENTSSALRLSKLKYVKEWPARSQPFFWSGVN